MLSIEKRISAFVKLGQFLRSLDDSAVLEISHRAYAANTWFDHRNVTEAIQGISLLLDEVNLREWLFGYDIKNIVPKKIGVIMAGNIPMVGFHDFLCVLLSGHYLLAKLSKDDNFLMKFLTNKLLEIEPELSGRFEFVEMLKDADAIIATGSDNTARYFEYYFAKKPHIIRKNRTSFGILTGRETFHELEALGNDIFKFFGLGCRNVSKLFVPTGYKFDPMFEALEKWNIIADHHKYRNNYDYNKSILLVNQVPHFDNGFLLVQKSDQVVSPISVVFFEYYDGLHDLEEKLNAIKNKTQVLVSAEGWVNGSVPFGQAQFPLITDYADRIDTMQFLSDLGRGQEVYIKSV